ncbi:secretagogin [Poecile atricapillus]|uniref:secretagogin n=1 Tax=Poecile atricapillus TaxID=48891 RepID=UPI0027399945|nr:secretagogin [Poecile atricapillus]
MESGADGRLDAAAFLGAWRRFDADGKWGHAWGEPAEGCVGAGPAGCHVGLCPGRGEAGPPGWVPVRMCGWVGAWDAAHGADVSELYPREVLQVFSSPPLSPHHEYHSSRDIVPGTRAVPLTINTFAFYLDNGYIEGKELDDFFHHLLEKLGPESTITEEKVQRMKEQFMSVYDVTTDGRLQIQELANMILPDDENFLLLFRRETPLDNSVEFMRIWRSYDADSSGFISAGELKDFLRDLFLQHNKMVAEVKLEEYTDTMMKIFDKNKDGRLDLNDLARILALQENFLLQFKMDACSTEERRRDFEKIFAHYDVSKTGALEGPEVDGFVKDMMELVKPSISGVDLDKFRQILLNHCDVNKDGKIQKSELALCLGLKINP